MKKQRFIQKNSVKKLGKLGDLVSAFVSIYLGTKILDEEMIVMMTIFANEILQRTKEFKLMNVVELEFRDKRNKEIEYRELKGIDKFIKKFLKENKNWKCEEESMVGIKTGRYILERVYRKYNKKEKDTEYCKTCGRSLEYDYD